MIALPRRALRRGAAALTTATLLASLFACTDEREPDGPEGPPDQVTYLTGFGKFGRDAYVDVADAKGYFAEENIEVEIQPGLGTLPNITQLVDGEADFVLGDFTGMLVAWANGGLPQEFTTVAAIQQQTLFAILALAESGIATPQDLAGVTIGDAAGSVGALLWPTYAESVGLSPDDADYDDSFEPQNLPALLAEGAIDAVTQFVVGEPTFENAAGGRDVVVLAYSDQFRDLFGNALYITTQMAEEDPDLVRRFTRALMRGLEDAVANPLEAGRILAEVNPEGPPAEVNAAELELMAPYVVPVDDPSAPLGSIDQQRVQRTIGILQSAGAIPEGISPEDIVDFSLVPSARES